MIIKDKQTLETYKQAGKLSAKILAQLREKIAVGVTPLEVDQLADELCKQHNVEPNFKGVGKVGNTYRHATCISVNDIVVHGIPNSRAFKKGDLVKVDFGIRYEGLNTDHCFTVGVEKVKPRDLKLIKAARDGILAAAKQAIVGNYTGDLGFIMQAEANKHGFTVAKEFVGHGIGLTLHDDPQIPSYGQPQTGSKLKKGMVLCVEAQYLGGDDTVYIDQDGWTVKTLDLANSAMFEYMVVVQEKQPLFLTPTLDWPIISR
ncbi:MAG: type I methionyl aminopeptidase [Patescibacteria group bacterium]|nr:type I methionyl aminopeptidase [Patescibacteria group bacterium]